MTRKNILLFFVFSLLLWAGCTKEDYRNCPTGLYVTLVPQNPKHVLNEMADRVDLYFYAEDGTLAHEFNFAQADLTADCSVFIPSLPYGDYTMLTVVNHQSCYRMYEKDKLNEVYSHLPVDWVETPPADIFTARQGVSLQPSGPLLHYVTANVTKHTNHINLKVRFEDYTPPAASRLNAYIEARNGEYHYVGHSCRDNTYKTYVPHQQGPTLDSPTDFRMTTLRLWHGEQEDIRLYVRETRSADPNQTRVVSLNLAEELAKVKNNVGEYLYNTNEKLEFHDEYDIILTLGPDFVVVGLTIANWSVIGGGVGV